MNGYGIDSLANFFLDFGYTQKEELRFPAKKLRALWFSPPNYVIPEGGSGVGGPLPRVFISELLVDQMSPETQVCHNVLGSMLPSYATNLFCFPVCLLVPSYSSHCLDCLL